MNQTEMLKRLEWSGKFKAAFEDFLSPCCPECSRVPERGHTKTCELNRLINQPQIDCPMTADELRAAIVEDETCQFDQKLYLINDEEIILLNKLSDWIDLIQSQPFTLPKEKP